MSNKYTTEQEAAIIRTLKCSGDFGTMKENLEKLLLEKQFSGMNIRELLAKAQHLAKNSKGEIIYHKKEYKAKTGETPIRKAVLIDQIEDALKLPIGSLASLEPATKLALLSILEAIKKLS